VVIVAVSGSWCPNCHDEAPYLQSLYRKYRGEGLEVVAFSFEEADQLQNPERLRAFVKQYGLEYAVLLAGEPEQLQEKLPQAKNLNSWPTTVFLGRDGRVRGVHAGFSGHATGSFYDEQAVEMEGLIQKLLKEHLESSR
jgi:thiol-disulfide isomerase/thioredoxin